MKIAVYKVEETKTKQGPIKHFGDFSHYISKSELNKKQKEKTSLFNRRTQQFINGFIISGSPKLFAPAD